MRYWSGVISGVVAAAIGLLAGVTGWLLPRLVDQVPALTGDEVPRATGVVTSTGWAVAAPAALGVMLLAASILPRRRETVRVVALMLVLVASAAVIGFTFLGISVALGEATLQIRAG